MVDLITILIRISMLNLLVFLCIIIFTILSMKKSRLGGITPSGFLNHFSYFIINLFLLIFFYSYTPSAEHVPYINMLSLMSK
jgi:hypothetical protein